MNRRELLQLIPLSLLTGMAPTLTLANENWPRIGIIAIGGISRSVLENTAFDRPHPTRTIAINTDAASLQRVQADHKILLQGFNTRLPEPEAVYRKASQVLPELDIAVTDLDMVLLVVGLGGEAGTGISPVVTQRLREKGILTLVVAISPFDFEGDDRHDVANLGLARLKAHAHALIAIRNSDIEKAVNPNDTLDAVMAHVPNTIHQLCRGIAGAVGNSSLIGIEFEDLRSAIAGHGGQCAFGYGVADNGINAADLAIKHPFLKHSHLQHASAALVAIEGPLDTMTMQEMKRVLDMVRSHLPAGAPVMYSCVVNPAGQRPTCTVSILAAGIQEPKNL